MRGKVWDMLELQLLHGFIAATRRRWDGGSEQEGTVVCDVCPCNQESTTVEIKEQETTSSFLSNKKLFHLGNMET
jgi:hypothetical protein